MQRPNALCPKMVKTYLKSPAVNAARLLKRVLLHWDKSH